MASLEEKSFCVLKYHTVSLCLLCNVHFVHSIRPTIVTWPRWSLQQWRISMHPCWRVCVCGKNLNIVSMCAVPPVVHSLKVYSCQKNPLFSFPVAVNNSIKLGRLVFLLPMFVITENILKHPVFYSHTDHRWKYGACALHVGYLRLQALSLLVIFTVSRLQRCWHVTGSMLCYRYYVCLFFSFVIFGFVRIRSRAALHCHDWWSAMQYGVSAL